MARSKNPCERWTAQQWKDYRDKHGTEFPPEYAKWLSKTTGLALKGSPLPTSMQRCSSAFVLSVIAGFALTGLYCPVAAKVTSPLAGGISTLVALPFAFLATLCGLARLTRKRMLDEGPLNAAAFAWGSAIGVCTLVLWVSIGLL